MLSVGGGCLCPATVDKCSCGDDHVCSGVRIEGHSDTPLCLFGTALSLRNRFQAIILPESLPRSRLRFVAHAFFITRQCDFHDCPAPIIATKECSCHRADTPARRVDRTVV